MVKRISGNPIRLLYMIKARTSTFGLLLCFIFTRPVADVSPQSSARMTVRALHHFESRIETIHVDASFSKKRGVVGTWCLHKVDGPEWSNCSVLPVVG